MDVNATNLNNLRVGFSIAFASGVAGMADSGFERVSTIVPATTKEQKYGWLGKFPSVREWIGPRMVHKMSQHDYAITEKPLELTIGVDRDDIETDNIGIYKPMFEEMGDSVGAKWGEMVWALLQAGFSTTCYDGQYFFDTDHPVIDADGVTINSVSNTGGGGGAAWFLMSTKRPLKPIILQRRRDFEFVARDNPTDSNVFTNKEFEYGADARGNVGFGFWQQAYGSKNTLNAANYAAARAAIMNFKGDNGRPLGLVPDLLVVAGTLESAARKLLNSENAAGGETNEWKGTADLIVSPWIS